MKVIGIVGYKNSGKTSLGLKLCEELTKRGFKVAVVKHCSTPLDLEGKDTSVYKKFASQVAKYY